MGFDFIYSVYVINFKTTFNEDFAQNQDTDDLKKEEDEEEAAREGGRSSEDATPN